MRREQISSRIKLKIYLDDYTAPLCNISLISLYSRAINIHSWQTERLPDGKKVAQAGKVNICLLVQFPPHHQLFFLSFISVIFCLHFGSFFFSSPFKSPNDIFKSGADFRGILRKLPLADQITISSLNICGDSQSRGFCVQEAITINQCTLLQIRIATSDYKRETC